MSFNIVLVEPEIPTNTGNIGRLTLAAGANLHLVEPLGFEIDDTRVKRAGLDYWKHLSLHVYESSEEFFKLHAGKKMALFSSHGEKDYCTICFEEEMFLIFGKESVGLSEDIVADNTDSLYRIPIHSPHVRSLNLANAVSIVVYEGLRQLR
ncbi:MAG: tRNA (cytidine(34)-2'-O)-methyltransferase [Cyclobacteriaceae bacterium]